MAKSGSPAGQQATYGYKEFLFGGLGACAAGCITNPLEVVKTRFQLQGELKARGHYVRTYRNVFHAFYTIGRVDGLLALQKGLVPALWYQFFMNGVRLGAFQSIKNLGFTADSRGSQSLWKNVVAGAMSGTVGAIVGSPVYMVKTHLQARAHEKIAVGFQHRHAGMLQAMQGIYREYGVRGLWRGVSGAIPRVMVGSAAQLSTFSMAHEWIEGLKVFKAGSVVTSLAAATMSGSVVVLFMTPFDVVSTRLYNQGVDARGRGLYYSGFTDCFTKVLAKEGVWGFYKGWGASLFRLGPHTVLSLVCWTEIRKAYHELESYGSDGTCS